MIKNFTMTTRHLSTTAFTQFNRASRGSAVHHFEVSVPISKQKYVPSVGKYPKGFLASGINVGVKTSNKSSPDLALLASEKLCTAAAVFTKNRFQAAPVTVSRQILERRNNSGIQSVIVNSGCANAVTGKRGLEDAENMATVTDKCFAQESDGQGERTIVMSTGVIGQSLPIQKILNGIPNAYLHLGSSHDHWLDAAQAICTTDTYPKLITKTFSLPSSPSIEYRIAGMAKGAGMIYPNMATLLGIIVTDVPISQSLIKPVLTTAVKDSFNSISVDGDTSTNDTVSLLANGAAGGNEITSQSSTDCIAFQKVLTDFSIDLAKLVVRDGEGATKFVTIRVVESPTENGARKIASTIAKSPLVRTALYGKDANWGRIICAVGYSQVSEPGQPECDYAGIVPEKTSVSLIPADGSSELKLLINGEPELINEDRASDVLQHEDIEILVKLGLGKEKATFWTCDFSHEYITINADYRT